MSKSTPTKSKFTISNAQAGEVLLAYLGQSRGVWSPSDRTPRIPGVDVFTPFRADRRAQLMNFGSAYLSSSLDSISSLSIFGSDDRGNTNRIGILDHKPHSREESGIWWNIALLHFDSPEAAKQATEVGVNVNEDTLPMGMPVVYLPELRGQDKTVDACLDAMAAQKRPQRGIPGMSVERSLLPAEDCTVALVAPSGGPGDADALWGNPIAPAQNRRSNQPQSSSGLGLSNDAQMDAF